MDQDPTKEMARTSRREFLATTAGTIAASLAGASLLAGGARAQSAPAPTGGGAVRKPGGRPNIVFVFTDQERYTTQWPKGLALPAHERLQRTGVQFHNHYCPATMCTSSRSVIVTGLQTVDNGMFENLDVPYVKNLSTKIPTIGHMLRKAGYYTAYKGKWHLSRKFDVDDPQKLLTAEMEKYGFADYNGIGDIIGHSLGGYQFDNLISASAVTWLRRHGRLLSDEGKPWCLFVSLVNPHDIMYFNTDLPGKKVQDTGHLLMHATPAPNNELYGATWDQPVAKSLTQSFAEPGRPKAHGEFDKIWDYVLGNIPPEEDRWRRFNDFYINSIKTVDSQVSNILGELDNLHLTDRTIFVYTSDHGEMAGSHALRGKGPFAYQETMHLPFYVVHPDVKGGQDTKALSSHVDVVPTLLSMAGVNATRQAEFAGRELPGKDLSNALTGARAADVHGVRESVLFTYSGLATNDSGLLKVISEGKATGTNRVVALAKAGYKPDMKKRGTVRTTFDGRYKFSRYFSPLDHNSPKNIDELYKWNDVELYDLQTDPAEMINLATNPTANRELIMTMNAKLEGVIKAEMGKDDGRELPNIPFIDWQVDVIS